MPQCPISRYFSVLLPFFSAHFYLIMFPLTPLLSLPLTYNTFSPLCFSPFLSLVLFPLLGLSLRSHLTITGSYRLFYLVLHCSSSSSLCPLYLFADFIPATSLFSLLHMHNKLVLPSPPPLLHQYMSTSVHPFHPLPYVFKERGGDGGGRCIPRREGFGFS